MSEPGGGPPNDRENEIRETDVRACQKCGKPHSARRITTARSSGVTWADSIDGHPYHPESWETLAGRMRAAMLTAEADLARTAAQAEKAIEDAVKVGAQLHVIRRDREELRAEAERLRAALERIDAIGDLAEDPEQSLAWQYSERLSNAQMTARAALAGAAADGENKPKVERSLSHFVAEREFLDASVAVWREIDRLSTGEGRYPGIPASTELRKRERAAWERYKLALLRAPADEETNG